ncbi:hypothetical protein ACFX15_013811 [Malus domestica]
MPNARRTIVVTLSATVVVRASLMPGVTAATNGRALGPTRRSLGGEKSRLKGGRARGGTGVLQIKCEDFRMKFLKGGVVV